MIVTIQFIASTFRKYNNYIFNNAIPEPKFRVSSSRRTLGSFRYPQNIRPELRTKYMERCTLSISGLLDRDQEELADTIIHEMIHCYIWITGQKDSSTHGRIFRHYMNDINRRLNRNIQIKSENIVGADNDGEIVYGKTARFFCITRWKDGRRMITVCARPYIVRFHREIKRHPDLTAIDWYVTRDVWFTCYPVVRSLKVFDITESEYARHVLPLESTNRITEHINKLTF